jgi:putative phage-type endonuclease
MTLIEYPDVEQRSDTWHDLRRGMVTASTVASLLTPTLKVADNDTSRGVTAALVAERITGVTEPSYMSDDMWRGVLHEPIARGYYAEHHNPVRECGFMVRQFDGFEIGLSPDGLVSDDGLIEIKCPRAKEHVRTILADAVPSQYMAQLQTALLVSGRAWIDYVSFHAGLPLYVKRVHRDLAWHDAILAAVEAFERNAERIVADWRAATRHLPATERIDLEIQVA